jgi:hypothetical protein
LQNDAVGQRGHHRTMPFLALPQLTLDAFLFADVLHRTEIDFRRSAGAGLDFGDLVDMPDSAIRAHNSVF